MSRLDWIGLATALGVGLALSGMITLVLWLAR
jgi:hypothetical protein